MKHAKKVLVLAVIGATLSSSAAWAVTAFRQDRGPFYADGSTQVRSKQEARNTWDDHFWRGEIFRCNPQSPGNCTVRFAKTNSKEVSRSKGWTVSGNLSSNDLSQKVQGSLNFAYQKVTTRTNSTGTMEGFDQPIRRGEWARAVAVQRRKHTTGVFYGGHFFRTRETPSRGGPSYLYDWKWKEFGKWADNRAYAAPYFQIIFSTGGVKKLPG
jgi:hypothetical protein